MDFRISSFFSGIRVSSFGLSWIWTLGFSDLELLVFPGFLDVWFFLDLGSVF